MSGFIELPGATAEHCKHKVRTLIQNMNPMLLLCGSLSLTETESMCSTAIAAAATTAAAYICDYPAAAAAAQSGAQPMRHPTAAVHPL
eukprot:7286-Heterococcus_DN1.PRE.1